MSNMSQEPDFNHPLPSQMAPVWESNKKLTTLSEVQPANIEKAYEFRE
jgi:hypothetical protein